VRTGGVIQDSTAAKAQLTKPGAIQMGQFVVYEVVREVRFQKWMHEVDAETFDEALARAKTGNDSRVSHRGELGEPEGVLSGWAARPRTPGLSDDEAWDEAYQAASESTTAHTHG
jgi:hypothetical protein